MRGRGRLFFVFFVVFGLLWRKREEREARRGEVRREGGG
ncbi:unnamed protein product [Linum tenue]|uniref:Uncharacterized protein n=1 Tax=Linum tenue TaxID=586396 RepID=A0AAV0QT59_9ROSI|nr:unnamed protein product [Linum tenue]